MIKFYFTGTEYRIGFRHSQEFVTGVNANDIHKIQSTEVFVLTGPKNREDERTVLVGLFQTADSQFSKSYGRKQALETALDDLSNIGEFTKYEARQLRKTVWDCYHSRAVNQHSNMISIGSTYRSLGARGNVFVGATS